jgi:hypothetical protein
VTENRYRPEGCAAGFYPILTIPQVRYVESMGGYSTLMALSIEDAEAMTDEGIQLHIKWVGAEPFFSQAAEQKGYLGATYDATYAAYVGKLLQLGEHEEDQAGKELQSSVLFAATDRDAVGRGDCLARPVRPCPWRASCRASARQNSKVKIWGVEVMRGGIDNDA